MRAPALRQAIRPLTALPRTQLRWQHVDLSHTFIDPLAQRPDHSTTSDIAFCFDIDGVLLRSAEPIPGASDALKTLQAHRIPFIFMTNGGGKHETERIADLSQKLSVPLDPSMIVQSHTIFDEHNRFVDHKDQCVLVVGGDGAKCREVAESYGYKNVVTPADIYAAHPEMWPFSKHFMDYYRSFARPLPKPINPASPEVSLKIDVVHVYNDPRDWGLDIQLLIDLLLSREGILGTISEKNGRRNLPNQGYLQDNQPHLYFSNPDITWASEHPLPRLGQGAFRSALNGVWNSVTDAKGGEPPAMSLLGHWDILGKPSMISFAFAQNRLKSYRDELLGPEAPPLKSVFMVGDNPLSDIHGANRMFGSIQNPIQWISVLTRTGVFTGTLPRERKKRPKFIVHDVAEAVALGLSYNDPSILDLDSSSEQASLDDDDAAPLSNDVTTTSPSTTKPCPILSVALDHTLLAQSIAIFAFSISDPAISFISSHNILSTHLLPQYDILSTSLASQLQRINGCQRRRQQVMDPSRQTLVNGEGDRNEMRRGSGAGRGGGGEGGRGNAGRGGRGKSFSGARDGLAVSPGRRVSTATGHRHESATNTTTDPSSFYHRWGHRRTISHPPATRATARPDTHVQQPLPQHPHSLQQQNKQRHNSRLLPQTAKRRSAAAGRRRREEQNQAQAQDQEPEPEQIAVPNHEVQFGGWWDRRGRARRTSEDWSVIQNYDASVWRNDELGWVPLQPEPEPQPQPQPLVKGTLGPVVMTVVVVPDEPTVTGEMQGFGVEDHGGLGELVSGEGWRKGWGWESAYGPSAEWIPVGRAADGRVGGGFGGSVCARESHDGGPLCDEVAEVEEEQESRKLVKMAKNRRKYMRRRRPGQPPQGWGGAVVHVPSEQATGN